jgi:hypothetical protein
LKSQGSIELIVTLSLYLIFAAAIMKSAFELYLPANSLYQRSKAELDQLRLAAYEAYFRDMEIGYLLDGEYSFSKNQISKGENSVPLPFDFESEAECKEKIVFSKKGDMAVVSCVPR